MAVTELALVTAKRSFSTTKAFASTSRAKLVYHDGTSLTWETIETSNPSVGLRNPACLQSQVSQRSDYFKFEINQVKEKVVCCSMVKTFKSSGLHVNNDTEYSHLKHPWKGAIKKAMIFSDLSRTIKIS